MTLRLVLTCEHGGNRVPARFADLFRSPEARRALADHNGLDLGSLAVAKGLATQLEAPLQCATVTRLLVDLNRSRGHPRLFSTYSRSLDTSRRAAVLEKYYEPYRRAVMDSIRCAADSGRRVLHVSVHSFTPNLDGRPRNADIGLLYDSRRPLERSLCIAWQAALKAADERLRTRRNFPYRGTADGLTTELRRFFPVQSYLGIELELNQQLLRERGAEALVALSESLARVLDSQR